jgi:AraC family transcriptional regulator, activator of mtrCDE
VPERLLRDHLPGRMLVRSCVPATSADAPRPDARLARLIELMREETFDPGPGSTTMVNHLSGALFALTLRFASATDAPRGLLALSQRPRLQPALAVMFEQPGQPWTLPELAALCHMSRATFARQFEEAIGRSPAEVLTEIRMTLAGQKLVQTSLPVAAIGESVGYQSEAAFQRVFKRHTGLTPAQWRTQVREQADAQATPEASITGP